MKRVRKDVCHVWAHQLQSDARYGNIFFSGDTIYSYGTHFPIARHVTHKGKHVILFTTRSYSVSTACHMNEVRGAIPAGIPVLYVSNPLEKPSKSDVEDYAKRIAYQSLVVTRAKSRMSSELHILQRLVDEANLFCETFGFKQRFTMPANTEEMKAVAAEYAAQKAKADKAKAAKERKEALAKVELWKAGQADYCRRVDGYDFLRLSKTGKAVETSARAVVPVKDVKRVAKLIVRKVVAGQEWHTNGEVIPVGNYSVHSVSANGDVRIGCHTFARAEIERFAAVLGVK